MEKRKRLTIPRRRFPYFNHVVTYTQNGKSRYEYDKMLLIKVNAENAQDAIAKAMLQFHMTIAKDKTTWVIQTVERQ